MAHALVFAFFLFAACEQQTIIYKDVPEYQLRQGFVPERVVMDDGTIIVHRPRKIGLSSADADSDRAGDESAPDGQPQSLRSLVPEQVMTHILVALRDNEYQQVWDELLSRRIKEQYGANDEGLDAFIAYMTANRDDLFAMLNRMSSSIYSTEVMQEEGPYGGVRYYFHKTVADQFKFAAVDLVYEDGGLKLLMIHPR